MRYIADHDYHIHSGLSLCSMDKEQTPARILQYAKENDLKDIILTDHHWDETVPMVEPLDFYVRQNYPYITQSLPLPQAEGIRFRFGCETELDKHFVLGVPAEHFDRFALVIIATTHLHIDGFAIDLPASFERRAELWIQRFDAVLNMDLPFDKVGIAHLTCSLIAGMQRDGALWEDHIRILDLIPDSEMYRLFTLSAKKGVGIELNFDPFLYSEEELPHILRIYQIAKECGCKFYFGSDAHHPDSFEDVRRRFERTIDLLELDEADKFHLPE